MTLSKRILLLLALSLFLTACAGLTDRRADRERDTTAQAERDRIAAEREAARVRGVELSPGFDGHPLEDPQSPLARRVIYFAFDSSAIEAEYREVVAAHARYLAANPSMKVVLEGHTDERGSREYNLGLGERRANSVRDLMLLNGVAPAQIDVISFGEERPVALGSDESAWRLNRRVEILYAGY